MLRLKDGPCIGVYACKYAPLYLRAVIDFDGEKDVLDLISDQPKLTEKLYVYMRDGEASSVHIKGTGISGIFAMAEYIFLPQHDGEQFRDFSKWLDFCKGRD